MRRCFQGRMLRRGGPPPTIVNRELHELELREGTAGRASQRRSRQGHKEKRRRDGERGDGCGEGGFKCVRWSGWQIWSG